MLAECLLALRRGEETVDAQAGAFFLAELGIIARKFMTTRPKTTKR